jgi:hypothetical protein
MDRARLGGPIRAMARHADDQTRRGPAELPLVRFNDFDRPDMAARNILSLYGPKTFRLADDT